MGPILFALRLAQDPMDAGRALGEAQSVSQVLGIVIGLLLVALVAVARFWLADRKKAEEDRLAAIKEQAEERKTWVEKEKELVARERDQVKVHAQEVLKLKGEQAETTERLMREMLDLVLRVEKALDQLARWREEQEE